MFTKFKIAYGPRPKRHHALFVPAKWWDGEGWVADPAQAKVYGYREGQAKLTDLMGVGSLAGGGMSSVGVMSLVGVE